jgi:hypothetical protein
MLRRLVFLTRALLAARLAGGEWPVAPLIAQGAAAAALGWLVSDALGVWSYAWAALSVSLAFTALPLLGEHAGAVSDDPAREWLEAQPVRAVEVRLARAFAIVGLTWILALAALVPLALLAPDSWTWDLRALLVGAGLAQAAFLVALLLALHAALGARAQALLVVLQTAVMGLVVVGSVAGLRHISALRDMDAAHGWIAWTPSAWFAQPFSSAGGLWQPLTAVALAGAALLCIAPARTQRGVHSGPLDALLAPLRALLVRTWVRDDERAGFAFTYEALPKERDFVLRVYPLLGIPLAFLYLGLQDEDPRLRGGIAALLAFAPVTYLPVLLSQVPGSRGHEARWILDTAPTTHEAIARGALKALYVRVLVPLYALIAVVACSIGEATSALQTIPISMLVCLYLLHALWGRCVTNLPLSVAPDRVEAPLDMVGTMMMLAMATTGLALATWKLLTPWSALGVCALAMLVQVVRHVTRQRRAHL